MGIETKEPRQIGALNIMLSGLVLDEQNPPKDGWVYYKMMENETLVLNFVDSREKVLEAAEAVFNTSAEISVAKRAHKEFKALLVGYKEAVTAFEKAVHSPGVVQTQEVIGLGGRNRWQRIIIYDLEDEEIEGDMVACRIYGDARSWFFNPFWCVNLDNGGVYPVLAPIGKQAVIVDRNGSTIRFCCYSHEDGWVVETFDKRKPVKAPPTLPKTTEKLAPPPPPDDKPEATVISEVPIICPECEAEIGVPFLDYQEAGTISCPNCKTSIGPLINGSTLLTADAVGVKVGLNEQMIVTLGEQNQPIYTIAGLAGMGDSDLRKMLKLKRTSEAATIILAAQAFMPDDNPEEDADQEDPQ